VVAAERHAAGVLRSGIGLYGYGPDIGLFAASTGALTLKRKSPLTAAFPVMAHLAPKGWKRMSEEAQCALSQRAIALTS